MTSLIFRGLGFAQDKLTNVLYGAETVTSKNSFYDCVAKKIDGEEISMSKFSNNVVLVVNVASKWGLTEQNYTELPKLYETFGERGFQILAFPCNQFGGQEPGTHDEIIEFVTNFDKDMTTKINFFEKIEVNGANTTEVFSFLKNALPADDGTKDTRWNFGKFLIDHEGKPYKRFGPSMPPSKIEKYIEELLAKKEGK